MIANFYFDSDTLIYLGNGNGLIYLLDTRASYQGFWKYPDGIILEINGEEWKLYADDGLTLLAGGQMKYEEDAAFLMNENGSSGGKVFFDEDGNLTDTSMVLTYIGESLSGGSTGDVPKG